MSCLAHIRSVSAAGHLRSRVSLFTMLLLVLFPLQDALESQQRNVVVLYITVGTDLLVSVLNMRTDGYTPYNSTHLLHVNLQSTWSNCKIQATAVKYLSEKSTTRYSHFTLIVWQCHYT